jgi:hypothetical protein
MTFTGFPLPKGDQEAGSIEEGAARDELPEAGTIWIPVVSIILLLLPDRAENAING